HHTQMKKLLLIVIILAAWVVSCGPSEQERAARQLENEQKINKKVDEIMQKLEASSSKPEPMRADTLADSNSAL
ncbi:MAG: hypothetical protein WEC59_00610, partial [Salibacteraceae bacterium]